MFWNKIKKEELHAPVNGNIINLESVEDEVFSSKMMGQGFAVEPFDGQICSPTKGEVISIFPTKHAIMIKTNENREMLIHMGIDTVELESQGFEILADEGENITIGTPLAIIDLDYLSEQNKLNTIIIVFPDNSDIQVNVNTGKVKLGESIGYIK
ncbi:PTS sugar transporter subunit IIA [Enterococcus casseliflavus]|uniref:PTS sugar transporter subunit IIA n=1 Tax=Enterococcus casseliflavus TaxID=37734 RepID=UPI0022E2A357|nr:PTS glucose transporter subunit IIA [Enterococcus casseliflavus]